MLRDSRRTSANAIVSQSLNVHMYSSNVQIKSLYANNPLISWLLQCFWRDLQRINVNYIIDSCCAKTISYKLQRHQLTRRHAPHGERWDWGICLYRQHHVVCINYKRWKLRIWFLTELHRLHLSPQTCSSRQRRKICFMTWLTRAVSDIRNRAYVFIIQNWIQITEVYYITSFPFS